MSGVRTPVFSWSMLLRTGSGIALICFWILVALRVSTTSVNHIGVSVLWALPLAVGAMLGGALLRAKRQRRAGAALLVSGLLTAIGIVALDQLNILVEYETWLKRGMPDRPFGARESPQGTGGIQRAMPSIEALKRDSAPEHRIEGAAAAHALLSPDRRFAIVWPGDASVPRIAVYDAAQWRRIAYIAVEGAVAARVTAARVRWTAGGRILLTWGAGTNVASGILYSMSGERLLEVDSSAIAVSPSLRYLVTYPALLADDPAIEVYDLATGRRVAEAASSTGSARAVSGIEWQGRQLVARYHDTAGQTHELRVKLDLGP